MSFPLSAEHNRQDQEWIEKGIDIWLIRDNLKLSYEERIAQHQNMLNLIDELKEIGFKNRAATSSPSEIINSKPC